MDDKFPLSCELQSFLRDHQKRISSANNVDSLQESLSCLVDAQCNGTLPSSFDLSSTEKDFIKAEFTKTHFVRCAEILLSAPAVEFLNDIDDLHKQQLEVFFQEGPSLEVFLVLVSSLSRTSKTEIAKVIVCFLEKFVLSKRMVDIFVKNCHRSTQDVNKSVQHKVNQPQTLTFIASLPERVANKLRLRSKSVFYPEEFFTEVAKQLQKSIETVHSVLAENPKGIDLSFLSELIGRICMAGHGRTLFSVLLPDLEDWTNRSPLWACMCMKLITGVPELELEAVVENLIKEANNPKIIGKLLGDTVLSNSRLKFLMTTKFLLVRYYSDFQILGNIVGYLSGCKRRALLMESLGKLFDSWSRSSSLQHMPYNQHVYISCCIVHIAGYLSNDEKAKEKQDILKKLLTGVQNHLESPDHKVRRLGMVVAECITSALEPLGEKLAFDYKDDDETLIIKDLSRGIKSEVIKNSEFSAKNQSPQKQEKLTTPTRKEVDLRPNKFNNKDDDDDDLEPYDLDEDEFEGQAPPRHLRDCIEALTDSEKMENFEAALKTVEKIVRSHPSDLDEICTELIKVLLHLQDHYTTEDFIDLKQKAMVAITTRCPLPVSNYLTEEFYGPNYSVIQRLDILDVLAASAQELSQPVEMLKEKAFSKRFLQQGTHSHTKIDEIPEWKKVVEERIESKTRRFAEGSVKEPPKAVANKFAEVAGHFFYPLMKNYDHKQNTLDLLGEDSFVLGRLIYTLGVIVHCARGTPGVCNMGVALLEFSWALRYHHQAVVRQVLVFALVMVFTSVPMALLMSENQEGVFEVHNWLKDLVEKDDNVNVKSTAVQALMVLEDAFKKEIVQNP